MLITDQQTIAGIESRLNQTRQPSSFEIDMTVTGTADIIKNKAITQNVVALIRGNDPVLQSEVIVLGAHYDHLGMGGPDSGSRRPDTTAVHNGADDNASGVAALLEVMEMLAANKNTLKRSVLGIAFGAEEMGTLGSRYFTDHPLVDLDKITAMINLDMIGRLDSLTKSISIGGSGTAREFSDIIARYADMADLRTQLTPEGYGPSDHASFYAQDIAVLSLMTGIHQDFHTPEDDIDKINFRGLKTVADFVYATIVDLANRQDVLVFQEAGPKSRPNMRRRFRVSLGIMPDIAATDIKGVRAIGVIPRKPAALAGMKKGDVIVAIEGKPVNGIYEYMHRLSDFKAGQRISVEVTRNGEKIVLSVQL
jgi:Zn-dependent M28 family amino/carboxypeptidase